MLSPVTLAMNVLVPLHILLDGNDFRDGIDDVPADLHQRHATTAGATPAELAAAYREALKRSAGDGVVAVHISAALSSTYSSAVSAAREFGPAVRVVNSRSAAMGVGFVALAAAQQAAAGADLDAVEAAARAAIPAATRSSSCTGSTTCGAAGASAGERRWWAPRCR